VKGQQVLVSLGHPVVLLDAAEGGGCPGRAHPHLVGAGQLDWSRGASLSLQPREVSSEGQTWKCAKLKACSIFLLNDPLQDILDLLISSFVKSSWCDLCTALGHGACREAPLCSFRDTFFTSASVGQKNKVILGTE